MKIKNEAELLSMFCDKNEFRELPRTPFFNTRNNEVWSTDGHALIRIKPERLVSEYPKGELTLPALEFPCKKKVTIEALNKALNECPKVDEEIVIQDAVECQECDGSGEVYGNTPTILVIPMSIWTNALYVTELGKLNTRR